MDYRNTQTYLEDRTKAPGVWPSPGLSSAGKKTDAEPTTPGLIQVVFPDAAVTGSGKQPPLAPGGPEKGPGHMEASEEWPSEELGTHEQSLPASSGKKQSSWTAQEGPGELQAGQDQAEPETDLRWPPSRLSVSPEGLLQPGVETEHRQEREWTPSPVEDQPPGSWQGTPQEDWEYQSPGHQAADGSDVVQPTEPSCTLDSCGELLGDNAPKEAGVPHAGPQEAVPEPSAEDLEDSSQEAMLLLPLTTAEEQTANPLFPSTPGPKTPEEGGEAVETQSAPGPPLPPDVRDAGGRSELCPAQKQLQEPAGAAGAQGPANPWQGFMKCLLEVEEEEATHRRASKARAPPARKSPRTLTPVSPSAPAGSSGPGLPPALLQTPPSAPATAPSWARPMAPGSAPVPMGALAPATVPGPVLPGPAVDLGWRRPELLPQSSERSLSYSKARQELEERSLLKLYQSCEEWSEEHLTQKQEEAFRSYFEIFNGPGEVDAQSLKNILLLVGFSLTPAQVEDALMSADVDGDGHVDFKDFLAVMTDSKRFFCSVEQNALANMAPPNPHTLLFEILSLLVEMLALPEAALEEITNYYQKKLKEGTCKAREMESAIGRLRARRKLSYNTQQADSFELSERKVLRILTRIKQQNYAANLQSPYAQVPCIPLCPRLDKKMVRRKQGNHYVLDQCASTSLSPDIRSLLFPSGPQGSREHGSDSGKWLGSLPARTH